MAGTWSIILAMVDSITNDVGVALEEIRRVIAGLGPPALGDLGLEGALRQLADRSTAGALTVRFTGRGLAAPLPAAVARAWV